MEKNIVNILRNLYEQNLIKYQSFKFKVIYSLPYIPYNNPNMLDKMQMQLNDMKNIMNRMENMMEEMRNNMNDIENMKKENRIKMKEMEKLIENYKINKK
mgnify:CR=1 FL=1